MTSWYTSRCDHLLPPQAVITDVELVAFFSGFTAPDREWPVASPWAPIPSVLVKGQRATVLVVADTYQRYCAVDGPDSILYAAYRRSDAPAGQAALEAALLRALLQSGVACGEVAVDPTAPVGVTALLRSEGSSLVITTLTPAADGGLVSAVRYAAGVADVGQAALRDAVEPGATELDLASFIEARMTAEVGARISTLLMVTTGPISGSNPGPATGRRVQRGDLVLCDLAPWVRGAWADAATTVCAGTPTSRQRKMFDAVRRALDYAERICVPGVLGRDLDRAVRACIDPDSNPYPHHTGHGVGVRWWQPPLITPYSTDRVEEGAIIALEPALYDPVEGGVRLEHTLRVSSTGNEILTTHEHRLHL
jgi:Xaa-Pro dipeptidase